MLSLPPLFLHTKFYIPIRKLIHQFWNPSSQFKTIYSCWKPSTSEITCSISQPNYQLGNPSVLTFWVCQSWRWQNYRRFFLFPAAEAIHLANLLCQYGYFFPVGESRSLIVKDDSSLYRFQVSYVKLLFQHFQIWNLITVKIHVLFRKQSKTNTTLTLYQFHVTNVSTYHCVKVFGLWKQILMLAMMLALFSLLKLRFSRTNLPSM